jgi:ferredoxin-like protein FixX
MPAAGENLESAVCLEIYGSNLVIQSSFMEAWNWCSRHLGLNFKFK